MSSGRKPAAASLVASPPLFKTSSNGGIPTPVFRNDSPSLSRKRTRSNGPTTPRTFLRPPSPFKSAQPVSRLFRRRSEHSGPRSVGASCNSDLLKTSHYSFRSPQTYFDQCFIVEEKLGAGSFGEVFKVKSKEDGKHYAVKITKQGFRGEMDRSYKLQEVNRHECLKPHPNCVQFYKAWEENGHLYIQTELCQKSLKAYCEQFEDAMDETFVWQCLADLTLGLKHIHDVDLGHFDIKPDNIFITRDGVCKIGDFGLMCDLSTNDVDEAQEGDPKYLAPELLQGKFGKAADIFSLGLTMLELSCNVDLPDRNEGWHLLRQGVISPDVTKHLSCELKEIIFSMLNPDPDLRPSVDNLLQNPRLATVASQRQLLPINRLAMSSLSTTDSSEDVPAPGSEDSFHPQLSSSFVEVTPTRGPSHPFTDPTESPVRKSLLVDDNVNRTPCRLCKTKILTSPLIPNGRSFTTDTPRASSLHPQRLFSDMQNDYPGRLCQYGPKNLLDAFEDVSD
ncbi:membrane-associated tyrosine- and threonine-specific cdc2-inhibitory kinase-like isoform X2 [Corticium candelabrum]|uniref:membrane-associated tyrosine- and threonine-specific cdc2-inhibitory kinase-like isoform X2 n=1 Tax=Corticium candelabrum TaxID=121492 RepID=UPI002E255F42|nr:membrane-associated tyrosine- and threonine-specific cdc2-inhibitory kinase-like isoform X2 [Corticium candelabrum]